MWFTSSVETWLPRLSLSTVDFEGFQSAGFPCIFQHVSLVWPVLWQWSYQYLFFFIRLSLEWWWTPQAASAYWFSMAAIVEDFPNLTFFLLSSLRTSLILDKRLVPSILPCTSSKFLLSPIKNLKILFFSTTSLYFLESDEQVQLCSSNRSSCCHWRVTVIELCNC